MTLDFIVAVRHHRAVENWSSVIEVVAQTARSIANQTSSEWRAVFVANRDTPMPALPSGVEVHTVEFDPPDLPPRNMDAEAYFQAIRVDKGRRLLAGLEALKPAGHVMVVDYDDLVSRRLAAYVAENQDSPGWFIDAGFLMEPPGRWALYRPTGFNHICGSSLVIHSSNYDPLLKASGDPRVALAARWLGSHRFLREDLADEGVRIGALPFAGAAWRLAGPGETSGARTLRTEVARQVRHPRSLLREVTRLRFVGPAMRREFLAAA